MGSRIQKIAFIVFALLFVAIMAVINTGILNMGVNANKQFSNTIQTSNSSTLELYNNSKISGDTVSAAAKNPDSLATSGMTVYVITKASSSETTRTRRSLLMPPTSTRLRSSSRICARTTTALSAASCSFRTVRMAPTLPRSMI